MTRALTVLVLAALPAVALAQVYKWKDQNGQVHYSQLPPKDRKAEVVGPPPPPGTNPNQAALNQSLSDAQKAAPEKQKAAELAALQQAQRQNACKDAMNRLAFLDARPPNRIATQDDKGNVSRMTPEEWSRQRAAEQDRIKQNCD